MRPHVRIFVLAVSFFRAGLAQQTVAPTTEQDGSARGEDWNDYNIVDSFETGYRFRTFGGSFDQYRSTVNFGDGVRLLSSYLTVSSRDGHGKFFDEAVLTTQGLGNDPYENATFRLQKNRLYRYDMTWRLNDYYNPGLRTGAAQGLHLLDTTYTLQDHDLTLFPQSNIKFFLGYTHGNQNGPALSSVQLFDSGGNEFPLFENVRRVRNEYRFGNEIRFFGVRLNWTHGWEDFKEDSAYQSGPNSGIVPSSNSLSSFQREEPYHGTSPYWRVGLFADRKYFSANGRFTYTSGERGFVMDETALGTARFGAALDRQIVTAGNAQRPVLTTDLNLSFFPTDRITIVNHTSVDNIRIDGNSSYAELDNTTQTLSYLVFEFLGIRRIANDTTIDLRVARWLGLFGGYQYSDRQIRSIEQNVFQGNVFNQPSEQTTLLHSGVFGIRLRPAKTLSIVLDGEIGRANRPLTPIAERNYQALSARVQYKIKPFLFSASTQANYNTNSVVLSTYAAHARGYNASAAWTPLTWFALDASYSKIHLDTAGGIAYFANAQFVQGEQSIYISNLHVANLTAHFDIKNRADLLAGYSHTQDTGDGRTTAPGPGTGSALPAFQAAQTFPLTFLSPMARFSLRITNKVRWNVGYQYYGYNERFLNGEDYRAHTGYSSLLWSF